MCDQRPPRLPRSEAPASRTPEKVGDAFNSMSILLGGPGEGERGTRSTASRAKTVKAVLDFAEASQRFRSRAP
jgi:hypothetical protein